MRTPKVGLNKIKRKNGFVYQVDYTINGQKKERLLEAARRKLS